MVDLPAPLPPPIQRMWRSRCSKLSRSREYRVTCVSYHPGHCEPARESLYELFFKTSCSSHAGREREDSRRKDASMISCIFPLYSSTGNRENPLLRSFEHEGLLLPPHTPVLPSCSQQVLVRPALDNASLVQNQDFITHIEFSQPVRHHHNCVVMTQRAQRV